MVPILKSTFPADTIPRNRSKDIARYDYFRGSISRGLWRFILYRFTRSSAWMIGITLLFVSYASNTLDIQAYTPVSYLLSIWLIAVISSLISRPRVRISARHGNRIRVGDTLPVDLEVTQLRRWRQDLNVVAHRLPPSVDQLPADGVRAQPLDFGESARLSIGLACHARGAHAWYGYRVETDFPFGLFRAYRTIHEPSTILVTPTFTPLFSLSVPAGRRYQPGGVAMASHLGDSFEFIGNREYRSGDNLRDMDWRATARLNMPIVRQYREEYFLRVGVVLDTFLPEHGGKLSTANFERAVSISAAVSDYMARSDYIVDLFAAGPRLYRLTAGRSLAYLDSILEILACVEGTQDEPFAMIEPEIVESMAQITSVVCIFLDWNERRMQFVETLRANGAGVKTLVVRDTPTTQDVRDLPIPGGITVIDAAMFAAGVTQL